MSAIARSHDQVRRNGGSLERARVHAKRGMARGIGSVSNLTGIGSSAWLLDRLGLGAEGGAGAAPRDAGRPTSRAAHERYAQLMGSNFMETISGVLKQAERGEFDDPAVAAEIQRLRAKLAHAAVRQAAGDVARGDGTGGAHAAPDMSVDSRPDPMVDSTAQQLARLEQQQAEIRLARVKQTLGARFTRGAAMRSTLDGGSDPESYRPGSRDEAAAFSERLTIDMTEGAARLGVTAARLDVARADAATDPTRWVQVQLLERQYATEQQQLQRVVDVAQTRGSVLDEVPVSGASMSSALIREAQRAGMDSATITELAKLDTIARDEAATGNSSLVNLAQSRLNTAIMNWFFRQEERRDQMRKEDERREQEQYDQDKAYEQRKRRQQDDADAVAAFVAQSRERQVLYEAHADARAQQRHAEYLAAIQARYGSAS